MPLTDFRIDGDTPPARPLPTLNRRLKVLAFDQAMRNTGYVLLDGRGQTPVISQARTLRTVANEQTGWRSTYIAQETMAFQIADVIRDHADVDLIVHESPPSARMARADSVLLAGLSVRLMARMFAPGVPVWMIGKQKAANILIGNPQAEKKMIKKTFQRIVDTTANTWVAGITEIAGNTYNEHQYDALALAIAGLVLDGEA